VDIGSTCKWSAYTGEKVTGLSLYNQLQQHRNPQPGFGHKLQDGAGVVPYHALSHEDLYDDREGRKFGCSTGRQLSDNGGGTGDIAYDDLHPFLMDNNIHKAQMRDGQQPKGKKLSLASHLQDPCFSKQGMKTSQKISQKQKQFEHIGFGPPAWCVTEVPAPDNGRSEDRKQTNQCLPTPTRYMHQIDEHRFPAQEAQLNGVPQALDVCQGAQTDPSGLVARETLKLQLQALQLEDPSNIFIARRINKLGFASTEQLRIHFSRYGEVKHVYVPRSCTKLFRSTGDPPPQTQRRRKAAALGFVVMMSPEATSRILLDGPEHNVAGVAIQVNTFLRSTYSNELEIDDEKMGVGSEDDGPKLFSPFNLVKISEQQLHDAMPAYYGD